jgi:hypothetical protein
MSRRLKLIALSVLFATPVLATAVDAAHRSDRTKTSVPAPQKRIYDDRDRHSWYPRDADQLKFGSQIWFEQMEREGRFGGSRRSR